MSELPDKIKSAIANGDLAVVRAWTELAPNNLWTRAGSETMLHKAAYYGQIPIMEYLLKKGIPLNITDSGKYTPLHEAARGGQVDAVSFLLQKGADIDARLGERADGHTPAEAARTDNAHEIVRRIEEHRSRPRWIRFEDDEVSQVQIKEGIGYKLTEIFNFRRKTYTLITHNLKTKTETCLQRNFADFEDNTAVSEAEGKFTDMGGKLDTVYACGFGKPAPRGL